MTIYLWLKLLAFGFAFLDTEVFVTGKHFNIHFYFFVFCYFCGEGWLEMNIFRFCVMEGESKKAHYSTVKAVAQRSIARQHTLFLFKRHNYSGGRRHNLIGKSWSLSICYLFKDVAKATDLNMHLWRSKELLNKSVFMLLSRVWTV